MQESESLRCLAVLCMVTVRFRSGDSDRSLCALER